MARNRSRGKGRQEAEIGSLSERPRGSWFLGIVKTIGAAGASIGLLASLLSLLPNLEISAEPPMDDEDLFSTPFAISNRGYLPLTEVLIYCRIEDVAATSGSLVRNVLTQDRVLPIRNLQPGERTTHDCHFPFDFKKKIDRARIEIIVSYHPWVLPWRQQRKTRFQAVTTSSGKLRWINRPMEE